MKPAKLTFKLVNQPKHTKPQAAQNANVRDERPFCAPAAET